jgi:mevalonate kinase
MNNFEKSMAEVFDVTPKVVEENKKETLPVVKSEKDNKEQELQQDLTDAYQQSKENLQEFLDHGKDALEELIQIAKAGQHPRAFEVYSGLLKNLVDANKELLATQKQIREMEGVKKESSGTNIDKAIFVGSTSELSKLLKGKKE